MSEIPKRLTPVRQTCREMYLKSGNLCEFPGCKALMMDEEGNFIGQLCHIEAAEPGGQRFNPAMTNEERCSVSNLMLMCYPHHQITNNEERYSVDELKRMKAAHERRFSGADRAMRERLGKLKWATLLGAGVVAGIGIDEIVRQNTSVLDRSSDSTENSRPKLLREELRQSIRYAPTGVVHWYSQDPLHTAVADPILGLFGAAGWRIERLEHLPPMGDREALPSEPFALMAFVVPRRDQLLIARQTVLEFFSKCGFSIGTRTKKAVREVRGYQITFIVSVGVEQH